MIDLPRLLQTESLAFAETNKSPSKPARGRELRTCPPPGPKMREIDLVMEDTMIATQPTKPTKKSHKSFPEPKDP